MKLSLKNFGIFKDKEFQLEQVTIFYGPNESGKTTILDSIVSSLVKLVGSKKYGKKINDRYGKENREAFLSDTKPKNLKNENFMNSLVIREGMMDVDLDDGDLIKSIEQSIFDSGLNPSELKENAIENFDKSPRKKSGKRLKLVLDNLTLKIEEFKKAEETLSLVSSKFLNLPNLEIQKQELFTKKTNLDKEIIQLESKIKEFEERENHKRFDEAYKLILEWEESQKNKNSDERLLGEKWDERTVQLESIIKSQSTLKIENSERIKSINSYLAKIRDQKLELETNFSKISKLIPLVSGWKKQILELQSSVSFLSRVEWNFSFLLISSLLMVFSVLGAVVLVVKEFAFLPYMLIPLFLIVSSAVLFYKAKKTSAVRDEEKLKTNLIQLTREIETNSMGDLKCPSADSESIQFALSQYENNFTKLKLELDQIDKDILNKQTEKHALEQKEAGLVETISEAEISLNQIWKDSGVGSQKEISELYLQIRVRLDRMKNLDLMVSNLLKDHSLSNVNELKLVVKDKLSEWENRGITSLYNSEDRILKQKFVSENTSKKQELKNLEKQYSELTNELDSKKAVLQSELIPAQKNWELSKKDMDRAEKEYQNVLFEFAAFEELSKIFGEMETESQNQMAQLVNALQLRMNSMKETGLDKKIIWNGFSESLKIIDESANTRDLDNLSTGTKEQIYYILRLEYAHRIGKQEGIEFLILDEPFRHMDEERRNFAVRYTVEFLKKENWKGVFFSFDRELVKLIQDLTNEKNIKCQIHELKRFGLN
ncbi:AAA family ATPase [Leptospira sp. 96542]|nr:AAA family ATPase [Leptospira sp. 96542]